MLFVVRERETDEAIEIVRSQRERRTRPLMLFVVRERRTRPLKLFVVRERDGRGR